MRSLCLILCLALMASADTIYGAQEWNPSLYGVGTVWFGPDLLVADDFTPIMTGEVETISIWVGAIATPDSAPITYEIHSGGTVPGTELWSFSGIPSWTFVGVVGTYFFYRLDLIVPPFQVAEGTQYWLVANRPNDDWAWACGNQQPEWGEQTLVSDDGGASWAHPASFAVGQYFAIQGSNMALTPMTWGAIKALW